jgi:hypothetical protein
VFKAQYADPSTNDVFIFSGWLQQRYPQLLPEGKQGGLYQHLKVDLHGPMQTLTNAGQPLPLRTKNPQALFFIVSS